MRAQLGQSKIVSRFKRLLSDENGNIGIVLGLSIIPMMLMMGAAVDFERASNAHTQLQVAIDSAALYAATLNDNSNELLTAHSQGYFDANYDTVKGATTVAYAVTNNGDSVTATATAVVDNGFMRLANIPTTTVKATSMVKKSGINIEVSMVLDNTGSMGSTGCRQVGSTTVCPIDDLKVAAANFVDTVMPASQGAFYTKIAAIPYNNGVKFDNAGAITARSAVAAGTSTTPGYQNYTFTTNFQDSKDGDGNWRNCSDHDSGGYCKKTFPITNCVTERTGVAAYTDGSVLTYPVGRSYLGPNNGCNVQPMVPLTTNATTLKSTISNMAAGQSTAGQVGIAWGWYALSPNIGMWTGASTPAGYDKLTTSDTLTRVKKVMILMTDAEYNSANYNGVITGVPTVPGSGSSLDHINQAATNGSVYTQANSVCGAIKAKGIEVFVITFQLKTVFQERVDLATNCATDAQHIINADTTSLDAAFSSIANSIIAMRIAQ